MRAPPRDCPCFSGRRYAACCAPFHRGGEPDDAVALMRSRYAAFALGLGEYLARTLSADHPDRALGDDALARALSVSRAGQRFLGLSILHHVPDPDRPEVLFYARIFSRGEDQSFAERARFARERGRLRYVDGDLVPRARLPPSPETMSLEAFTEAYGALDPRTSP